MISINQASCSEPEILLVLLCISLAIPANPGRADLHHVCKRSREYRGATIAPHSKVGFGLSEVDGRAVGGALDMDGMA